MPDDVQYAYVQTKQRGENYYHTIYSRSCVWESISACNFDIKDCNYLKANFSNETELFDWIRDWILELYFKFIQGDHVSFDDFFVFWFHSKVNDERRRDLETLNEVVPTLVSHFSRQNITKVKPLIEALVKEDFVTIYRQKKIRKMS